MIAIAAIFFIALRVKWLRQTISAKQKKVEHNVNKWEDKFDTLGDSGDHINHVHNFGDSYGDDNDGMSLLPFLTF